MKNWLLLISFVIITSITFFSCNKKTQKNQVKNNKTEIEEKDSFKNQEIHAPKSDDPIEINKKKQEQTEKKLNTQPSETEEKSK